MKIRLTDPSPSASKSTSGSFNKVDQHTVGKQQNEHRVDTKISRNVLTANINNIVPTIYLTQHIFNLTQPIIFDDRLKASITTSKKPKMTPRGGKVSPDGSQKTSKRAPKTPKCLLKTPKRPEQRP